MKSMNKTLNEKDEYILQLEEQIEFLHQRTKELENQLAKLPLKGKDANEPTADKEEQISTLSASVPTNPKDPNTLLSILCSITFKNGEMKEFLGMIDTGASKSHILETEIPSSQISTMKAVYGTQMDGTQLKYDKCLKDAKISFWDWGSGNFGEKIIMRRSTSGKASDRGNTSRARLSPRQGGHSLILPCHNEIPDYATLQPEPSGEIVKTTLAPLAGGRQLVPPLGINQYLIEGSSSTSTSIPLVDDTQRQLRMYFNPRVPLPELLDDSRQLIFQKAEASGHARLKAIQQFLQQIAEDGINRSGIGFSWDTYYSATEGKLKRCNRCEGETADGIPLDSYTQLLDIYSEEYKNGEDQYEYRGADLGDDLPNDDPDEPEGIDFYDDLDSVGWENLENQMEG
ncbi:hypothetical protein SLEP1_g40641 [Rubroshorea leprosula]|uniref:Peptidase A2 domain-containing protein n=1 Tax=Rubroshorea leprosula TaxID=152421 RepID=A0AAV5L4C3_9ROSI|nr:hypothetical protein SLEP1_g40641 [Rubroshorea leprosula]